jgi:serine/threonine-protein kinase
MSRPAVPNQIVARKYRLERTLGEGGMGIVVAARHLELDQLVAIKFLRPEIAREGDAAERFRREARAVVRIRSDHVCRVLDVGTLESGVPYMVMEYLEGHDLAQELQNRKRLPVEEAVDYVLQACDAIAEAHAAGIVHRDLKPENLFLARTSGGTLRIKVLDFGVSKSVIQGEAPQLQLTRTSSLVGSPIYMSPEQLEGSRDIDGRADIWGLGTILYELLTGRTPFVADTIGHLVRAVMLDAPPVFVALGVEVPAELESAIFRTLEKQRTTRFDSVRDFAKALLPFAPPSSRLSSRREAEGSGDPSGERRQEWQGGTPRTWWSSRAPRRSRRLRFAAAVLLTLGVILGLVVYRRPGVTNSATKRVEQSSASPASLTTSAAAAAATESRSAAETASAWAADSTASLSGSSAPVAPLVARADPVVRQLRVVKPTTANLEAPGRQAVARKAESPNGLAPRSAAGAVSAELATSFRDFGGRR